MIARQFGFVVVAAVAAGLVRSPLSGEEPVVCNWSVLEAVRPGAFAPPKEPLGPVKLAGARNGTYAAQVVVSAAQPITGLKAVATELKGPGVIPADAVKIRYALPDGPAAKRGEVGFFDSLEDSPPAEVAILKDCTLAVQPVWIAVAIPTDARPGDYTGKVTLSMQSARPVDVVVQLRVADWTLPRSSDFAAHMDIIESPESVAMAYDVELWSDAHFKLLDRTFALLAPLAAKTVYITCIRRTHFGNEHAMVPWVVDDKGEFQPDFQFAEKYLDVAARHLGKVPGVILYCWEPIESMGHAGGAGQAGRTTDRPPTISVWDSKRQELGKRIGPAWGTPESREFWKKLTDGIRPVLAKRGLEQSMLLGLVGDARPTKVAMDEIANGVPEAKWAMHSHYYADTWQGYKLGMCVALWGIHLNIVDPKDGHGYGWQNPFWLAYYPREMSVHSPLVEHRYKLEMWMGAWSRFEMSKYGKSRTARGLGRIGGDFWPVVKDTRGRPAATLAGRYPESYWGQLNLNYCISSILGRGAAGAVPTVRSEAFRECIQDMEARVFVEKAILDEAAKARLGEELATRCRTVLNERIRLANQAGGARQDQVAGIKFRPPAVPPDWQDRNRTLYDLAAEVAGKLKAGNRE